jgi:hypothetical protein
MDNSMVSPGKRGEPIYRRKTFLLARRSGRLGNRLVIFATFIALVRERGDRLINFTFHTYAHLYPQPKSDIYCQFPIPSRRSIMDRIPGLAAALRKTRLLYHLTRYASGINEKFPLAGRRVVTLKELRGQEITPLEGSYVQDAIRDARIVYVNGWNFRVPQLVEKHAQAVRDYFRPQPEFENAARETVAALRRQTEVLVGVHVRHGDYKEWRSGRYYFTPERYGAWMKEMESQLGGRKVLFMVCSDSQWKPQDFGGPNVAFGPGSPVGDMTALSMCDYIFGPVSTFTQWSSFYGGKPLLHVDSGDNPAVIANFKVNWLGNIPGYDPIYEPPGSVQVAEAGPG